MNNVTAMPVHASEVARLCSDFVELRRATGLKYNSEAKILRQFSRYCEESFPGRTVPEDALYNWVNGGTNQSLRTRYGKANILYGDYSYYWLADREGRSLQRLNELYAATDQIGFKITQRVDGRLILPEAVKCLKMKVA